MGDDNGIWCEIRLADVAAVIEGYVVWKDSAWYHSVNWREVCLAFARLLQTRARSGVISDVLVAVDGVKLSSTVDREGLTSLVLEPITITKVQLTNGGHRLKAMSRQGVLSVPGMFHPDDVGESVRPEQVYPSRAGQSW